MAIELSLNSILGLNGLYATLSAIFVLLVVLILVLRSGQGYSVQDTEKHSTEYAGVIKEGHGGLTVFLWVVYATMVVWTVVYFIQHTGEFSILFAG